MEPTPQQLEAIQAADAARMVLDNPLISRALADIEQAVIEQWAALGVENKAQAEELKRLLWAAKQFRSIFEVTIAGGTVARNELLNASTMEIRRDAALRRIYG